MRACNYNVYKAFFSGRARGPGYEAKVCSSLVPRPTRAPGEEGLILVVFAFAHKLPQNRRNVCMHAERRCLESQADNVDSEQLPCSGDALFCPIFSSLIPVLAVMCLHLQFSVTVRMH